jgi:hypothetical protein
VFEPPPAGNLIPIRTRRPSKTLMKGQGEKAMSKKEDAIAVEGKVIEPLPNAMFRVEMDSGHKVSLRPDPRSDYLQIQVGRPSPVLGVPLASAEESWGPGSPHLACM